MVTAFGRFRPGVRPLIVYHNLLNQNGTGQVLNFPEFGIGATLLSSVRVLNYNSR